MSWPGQLDEGGTWGELVDGQEDPGVATRHREMPLVCLAVVTVPSAPTNLDLIFIFAVAEGEPKS